MRITVEISDEQRARLLELAARRGLKGFSPLVREALGRYLDDVEREEEAVRGAVEVLGTLPEDEAEALHESVNRLRSRWRW